MRPRGDPSGRSFDVAVVGAGAAGLMAAVHAAGGGVRTVVLDGMPSAGSKLLITGGGRCNILPAAASGSSYVSGATVNSLRRILLSWSADAARGFFQSAGVVIQAETGTGKLFPASGRASDVRDALLSKARASGALFRFRNRVESISMMPGGEGWVVSTEGGEAACGRMILACGGCTWPETGSDGSGFALASSAGHSIVPPVPALAPLACSEPGWSALSGITCTVTISGSSGKRLSQGALLISHGGFSGPAVLDASHAWKEGLFVQWCGRDARRWEESLLAGRGRVVALLREELPARLCAKLVESAGLPGDSPFADLTRESRRRLLDCLCRFRLPVSGVLEPGRAEVTAGGVPLAEIRTSSMESRLAPGLYLAGEMLDATGPVGGYNLYWAWLTGRLAGMSAAASLRDPARWTPSPGRTGSSPRGIPDRS